MGTVNQFDILAQVNNGSTTSPFAKHKCAVSLTEAQLNQLAIEERKTEVDKIKKDIQILEAKKSEIEKRKSKIKKKKEEEKKNRDAEGAGPKEGGDREGAEQEKSQDSLTVQDQDEAGDSELGEGWKTAKRRGKR